MKKFIVKRTAIYEVSANSKEEARNLVKNGIVKKNMRPAKRVFSVFTKPDQD